MVKPRKVQEVVKSGYERLQKFRKARAMFIREAVGQYYADEYGVTGSSLLISSSPAIRAMIRSSFHETQSIRSRQTFWPISNTPNCFRSVSIKSSAGVT